MTNEKRVADAMAQAPVVAILRGVRPAEVAAVAEALVAEGVRLIEVPLNSPEPLESIRLLARHVGDAAVVGAGTVLEPADVDRVADAGGQIIVTPNTNAAVISRALERGLVPMPGFLTPTEAFAALAAGARYIKLFPAGSLGLGYYKAIKAVLPASAGVLAVGGVGPANAREWMDAGVAGLGIGTDLFRPGDTPEVVRAKARAIMAAVQG
ncbi:2-dehydro-3-deoxy-6-phosphogalactonate aldolase [Pedomonas sp. V897]|uniref:2-dehydro-3-deoxy-6-phosphogalactonate aldolase n=1 Tax=Pedomonas sp. V897 TaxID=3446482 RepID=UPI003EDE8624